MKRGGLKLEGAIRDFQIEVAGRVCLDVGASTGGFTDCLLQHGALHVTGLGYSTKTYGLLQAMNRALVVLFELPISAWTQHRTRPHMVALGAVLVGGGFAVLAFVHALPRLRMPNWANTPPATFRTCLIARS